MRMLSILSGALLAVVGLGAAPAPAQDKAEEQPSARSIFERRILPILRAEKPSSCAECHLSGLDLKDYIRPSDEETFAALLRGGMVDRAHPDESKLLAFISRKPDKPSIVTEKVREQEYAAFREWIVAAVNDPRLLAAKAGEASVGPRVPEEVIRHARQDRVLASFVENVWSETTRCAHCHSPEFNRGQIANRGQEFVDRISWIVPRDPEATLRRIVAGGLIDLEDPAKSRLLTKPTVQVEHQGGIKMVVGDRGYEQFRRFAVDYAASAKGAYRTAAQLPRPSDEVAVLSDLFLRIEGLPEAYGKRLMRVEVHPWNEKDQAWSNECWASGAWIATPQQFWQSPLHLTASRTSPRAQDLAEKKLPPGRYLAKLYLDKKAVHQVKQPLVLGEVELVGQIEFESRWPSGFANKTVIHLPTP